MLQRSHFGSDNARTVARYLGSGIDVCARWLSFENFLEDMGQRPARTTLDRVDTTKGYAPGNCRWATSEEQASNKTNSVMVTARGRSQSVAQWARELGVSRQALRYRLRVGWTHEDAVAVPFNHGNGRKKRCDYRR